MLDTYANLIPVILIAMLILYEENVAYIANTPLGKIAAILLIVYYTSVDLLYGLFMCALIVLYYQSDNIRIKGLGFGIDNFSPMQDSAIKDFKEQNCKNGMLLNKGSPINLEMLEHIHPDINFKYEKCNPCSDTCEFSLIDEQIKAEESLKPTTADDFSIDKFTDKLVNNIKDKISDFIPALWVKSEPFASLE
jgi:hypothetical protein